MPTESCGMRTELTVACMGFRGFTGEKLLVMESQKRERCKRARSVAARMEAAGGGGGGEGK